MPVRDVLARHSSREISEWQGFERAYGPIDHTHQTELLTQLIEATQTVAYLVGAQLETNPMPTPKPMPRLGLLNQLPEDDDPEEGVPEWVLSLPSDSP